MSTKIYNAFKVVNVKKPITLNTLSEINKNLKEEAFKIFREELVEAIGRRVWYFQDLYSYYGEDIFEKIKDKDIIACINRIKDGTDLESIARHDILNLKSQLKDKDNSEYLSDFGQFKIIYFPDKSNVFGMYFGDNTYSKIIWANEYFEDYSYQNQTDMPDGMTKQRWKTREKTWDRIFDTDSIPKNHGFEVEILNCNDSTTLFNILEDKSFGKEAVNFGKKEINKRVRRVRETVNCPLFPDGADYETIAKISRSNEYNEWCELVEKDIESKLIS